MRIVELEGIRRTYERGVEVLRGVDLAVGAGEVVGLVGRNGAGKTTLLRVAMGLLEPQAGSVRVFGLEHRDASVEIKRRVGYVSEDQVLPAFLRVDDVLDLHRTLYPTWDRGLEERLAARFELPRRARVGKLSKGEARRVAIACAVAHRPELLVLDEPAGGLDPAARREFLGIAIEALEEDGSAILFSSHHMGDVERIAGRLVLLHEGRVLLDRELDRLREELALAVLSPNDGITAESLRARPGCVAARRHAGELRAVFERAPGALRRELERELPSAGVATAALGLEDLFVEAVEGQAP